MMFVILSEAKNLLDINEQNPNLTHMNTTIAQLTFDKFPTDKHDLEQEG